MGVSRGDFSLFVAVSDIYSLFPKDSVSGLRDLALIAAMFYSFARVSAVLKLNVDDYYHNARTGG
jgi:hypothetical protein